MTVPSAETVRAEEADNRPVIIFHVPFALNPAAKSASGIRPVRMRQAFEAIGYRVIEVSGRHAERKQIMRTLRRDITAGLSVDFVYSEAATTPTGLGEKVTPATSLTRDISFLRFCRRRGIPVGLFYRDVYWRFPIYDEVVKWPLSAGLRWRYRADLRGYRRAGIDVYLPSLAMAEHVPIIDTKRFRALPPGGRVAECSIPSAGSRPGLRLLYVGGLGSNYRLHESVRAVAEHREASLTICTREAEWDQRATEYPFGSGSGISVVHRSGDALDALYRETDICLLAVEPIAYWGFAVPVKLLEYLGHGKPVVASEGTYSADFVREQGIGWVVRYGTDELQRLLDRLAEHPEEVAEKAARAREVREEHTWEARARQVVEDLTGAS